MNGENILDRLYFENDRPFNHDIGSIGAIETNTFVNQRQFDLSFKAQTGMRELKCKTIFINLFQKPRPNCPMYFNRQSNHSIGHAFPIRFPSVLFAILARFAVFVMHRTPPRQERFHHPPVI